MEKPTVTMIDNNLRQVIKRDKWQVAYKLENRYLCLKKYGSEWVIHWYDPTKDYYYLGTYTRSLSEACRALDKKVKDCKLDLIARKDRLEATLVLELKELKRFKAQYAEDSERVQKKEGFLCSIEELKTLIKETKEDLDAIEVELVQLWHETKI